LTLCSPPTTDNDYLVAPDELKEQKQNQNAAGSERFFDHRDDPTIEIAVLLPDSVLIVDSHADTFISDRK
jgi:hypothetical protein